MAKTMKKDRPKYNFLGEFNSETLTIRKRMNFFKYYPERHRARRSGGICTKKFFFKSKKQVDKREGISI